MRPVSLSKFRIEIFNYFKLMKDNNAIFEIYHRRKIYRIYVEQTGRKYTVPYKKQEKKSVVPTGLVDTTPCSKCSSLLINGICMNKDCVANQGS